MGTIQERLGGIEARLDSLCRDVGRVMLFLMGNGNPEGGIVGEVARLKEGAQRRRRFVVAFYMVVLALLGGLLTERWATYAAGGARQPVTQERVVVP